MKEQFTGPPEYHRMESSHDLWESAIGWTPILYDDHKLITNVFSKYYTFGLTIDHVHELTISAHMNTSAIIQHVHIV